jgi:hypothetical protein
VNSLLNPQAVGTLLELDEEAIDQDHRQMVLIRKALKYFKQIEEKRHDPDTVLTLARLGQQVQEESEQEEKSDQANNQRRKETTKAILRLLTEESA